MSRRGFDDLRYAVQVFSQASRILATYPGRIHERLIPACIEICHFNFEGGYDGVAAEQMGELYERVTAWKSGPDDGWIANTVGLLSEDEAVEIAKEILAIAYELREEFRT